MKANTKTRKPLAERLEIALRDGIAHAKGQRNLKTTAVFVPESRLYTGRQVAELRARYGCSQAQFAQVLATSVKTLQSWEQDQRSPSRPTVRLLQVLDEPGEFQEVFSLARPRSRKRRR